MTDILRRETIKAFNSLYSPRDLHNNLAHMPTEAEDPDGTLFEEYFDFLQTRETFYRTPTERVKQVLLELAKKFDYPVYNLRYIKITDAKEPETVT